MKKLIIPLCLFVFFGWSLQGQTVVHIADPSDWSTGDVTRYIGQTVRFDVPFYICNNYSYRNGSYTVAPRRIFSPPNQAVPGSLEYTTIVSANPSAEVTLSGISDYHRMGEKMEGLTVRINSANRWTLVDEPRFVGNSRDDMQAGCPSVDMLGKHTLLVCAFNLEYYLVDNIGTGFGPGNSSESQRQHTKIMDALEHIKADIYGFVEIEQGQSALKKLAASLTAATGRNYRYIDDGGSAYGSYTKSGYIYCSDKVAPYGDIYNNETGVSHRKKLIAFTDLASGERFIFSLNHFKAKSGTGTGDDADQGDGQGTFNASRVREAQSVLASYNNRKNYYGDEDILIMGDLNAYAKEDPIRVFTDNGMTDLHRYFHADTSYSYVFHDQAGYLDHAIANSTLLKQITGMQAYHINSDEHDSFTYDKSSDQTMFRSSDHDPVLVGLALGKDLGTNADSNAERCQVELIDEQLHIDNAMGGYYRIYNIMGTLLTQGNITQADYTLDMSTTKGFYILDIYVENTVKQVKLFIP